MSEPKDDESSVAQTARQIIIAQTVRQINNAPIAYPNTDPSFLTPAAREKERELMSQTLGTANSQPPAIRLKTRFISIPKGTAATIAKYLNATNQNGKPMGLLSANDNQALLKLLGATEGVETLGEPEVTMMSGRQSQVRATEMVSVITHPATNGRSAAVPQTNSVEVGPTLDLIPYLLNDGYAINLAAIPFWTEFVNGNSQTQPLRQNSPSDDPLSNSFPQRSDRQIISNVNLWDGQTLLLTGLSMDTKNTATTVDGLPGDAPHFGGLIDLKSEPRGPVDFNYPHDRGRSHPTASIRRPISSPCRPFRRSRSKTGNFEILNRRKRTERRAGEERTTSESGRRPTPPRFAVPSGRSAATATTKSRNPMFSTVQFPVCCLAGFPPNGHCADFGRCPGRAIEISRGLSDQRKRYPR